MLKNIKKYSSDKRTVKTIPEEPGIYIFWEDKKPIYIGKAINLRRRLESYWAAKLTPKTAALRAAANYISYIKVPSEIEALLLEAELIWRNKPKYNQALKDDKHPLYIMISKEEYPRVIMCRRDELNIPNQKIFGPFPSTGNMRYVLKMLRPIFPYANHIPGVRTCLYSQLGLCNPCPSYIVNIKDPNLRNIMKKEYLKNVKYIKGILSGRIKTIHNNLRKEMDNFANDEKYEEAKLTKDKIRRLEYITRPIVDVDKFVGNPNLIEDIREDELINLKSLLSKYLKLNSIKRIECFDVAHLGGAFQTASMVTFIGGVAEKSYYRHFRIRSNKRGDDYSSLGEVAIRREKKLDEWGRPDLIIVDGGKGQVNEFYEIYKKYDIPVIGLSKRFETIIIPLNSKRFIQVRPSGSALALVQRIRNEAHRFARRYHHKLLQKNLLTN